MQDKGDRMNRQLLSLAAAAVALCMSAGASAQGYVGLAGGPTRIDIDCTGATTCDKTDNGFKLYGGLRLPSNWAFEGLYVDWGSAKATVTGVIPEVSGPITGEGTVDATGFGGAVAYFMPFTQNWTGVVRLGVMRNKAKTTASALGLSASESFTGTFAYAGVGIGYNVMPNLTLTSEADFSRVKYTSDGDKADLRLISVGLRYAF
jgi:OOP family OmpA-OmpF porin